MLTKYELKKVNISEIMHILIIKTMRVKHFFVKTFAFVFGVGTFLFPISTYAATEYVTFVTNVDFYIVTGRLYELSLPDLFKIVKYWITSAAFLW